MRRSKKATAELKATVLARDSRLMDLHGVGPVVAARILADVGDISRFADRNRFASWTGTAPLDASSGEQNRHRLSRAGNGRMNHMIHIAAVTQVRLDTEGRATTDASAPTARSHGSDALPQAAHLRPSTDNWSPTPSERHWQCVPDRGRGPGRALRGDSRIQRGRPAPAHRHFGSATSGPAPTTLQLTSPRRKTTSDQRLSPAS